MFKIENVVELEDMMSKNKFLLIDYPIVVKIILDSEYGWISNLINNIINNLKITRVALYKNKCIYLLLHNNNDVENRVIEKNEIIDCIRPIMEKTAINYNIKIFNIHIDDLRSYLEYNNDPSIIGNMFIHNIRIDEVNKNKMHHEIVEKQYRHIDRIINQKFKTHYIFRHYIAK